VNEIQLNAMPLPAYRLFHPESVITPQQLSMVEAIPQATNSE
jgi:anthranilate/para-aminobenzoate synthase component II